MNTLTLNMSKTSPIMQYNKNDASGQSMELTTEGIRQVIRDLATSIQNARNLSTSIMYSDIMRVGNYWQSKEAQLYVDKINTAIINMSKTTECLELLMKTYQKVLTSMGETQESVMMSIMREI